MRTKLFTLLAIVAAFSACNMESESNYSPTMRFTQYPVVINRADTLSVGITDKNNVYKLDSINVGDTVSFKIFISGYVNNLVSFSLTQSADSVSRIILPSKATLDSIFLPTSNYGQGNFILKSKVVSVFFPFKYVAMKKSNEAKIKFFVASDANFDSNTYSFELVTPIKNALTIE